MELKSTEAQLKAYRTYKEKNKGKARLPGGFLNDDTAKKLEELAEIKGTKMSVINEAIALLHQAEIKKEK